MNTFQVDWGHDSERSEWCGECSGCAQDCPEVGPRTGGLLSPFKAAAAEETSEEVQPKAGSFHHSSKAENADLNCNRVGDGTHAQNSTKTLHRVSQPKTAFS